MSGGVRLGLAAALALAALGWTFWRPAPRADGAVAASSAPASVPRNSAGLAAEAVHVDRLARPPGVSARSELAQRMKADWCGFGAAEAERQSAEVTDRAVAQSGTVGPEAVAELSTTVGGEVREEAVAQVRRRWGEALMKRGDVRSMALADFLGFGADAGSDSAAQARARLQARARTSSDPFVTALALQRPCESGACTNIEASQWSRLEPDNLRAWAALLDQPARGAEPVLAGYVLERIAAQGRYSRTYQREFKEALQSLPQTEAPGLQAEAETALIDGVSAAWQVRSLRPVMDLCRAGLPDAGTAARCEALADVLWQQGDLMDRAQSISLARSLVQGRAALRARWEPRARAYEAGNAWMAGSAERLRQEEAAGQGAPAGCAALLKLREQMRSQAGRSEWEVVRAEMHEAGVDEAALSALWREEAGRSVLDPIPAAPGAAPRR